MHPRVGTRMANIQFDPLVGETFDRILSGIALLELLDESLPKAAFQEQEGLRTLAKQEQWDLGDHFIETQVLDEKYHSVARLSAYAITTLLYSVLETQLFGLAERVGRAKNSNLTVRDVRGRPLEQAQIYLERVGGLDVAKDPAWSSFLDLQRIRNIVVHANGKPSKKQQSEIGQLEKKYGGLLESTPDHWGEREIFISMNLCRRWSADLEGFFKRIFKAVGLPEKGLTIT